MGQPAAPSGLNPAAKASTKAINRRDLATYINTVATTEKKRRIKALRAS